MHIQVLESPLGPLTASWSNIGLCSLSFGASSLDASSLDAESNSTDSACTILHDAIQRSLANALAEYFDGGEFEFPLAHCDWTGVPSFHRQVLVRCAKIKRGETMSYGQLASAVGNPKAARAVGQAMARNRWPLLIPCHRVLGQSGRMTGYSGAGGTDTKKSLLDFESGSSFAAFQLI